MPTLLTPDRHRRPGGDGRESTRLATRGRVPMLAVLLALGATAAGCGSSSSPAAAAKSAGSSSRYQQSLKYSDCMRSHGVAGFPDPQAGGALLIGGGPGSAVNPSSPSFASAQKACAKLMPSAPDGASGGGLPPQAKQDALKYSACMRSHGVPGFPDPAFSGGGARLQLSAGSGVVPSSPAFKAAQKACGSPFPQGQVSASNSVGGPG